MRVTAVETTLKEDWPSFVSLQGVTTHNVGEHCDTLSPGRQPHGLGRGRLLSRPAEDCSANL